MEADPEKKARPHDPNWAGCARLLAVPKYPAPGELTRTRKSKGFFNRKSSREINAKHGWSINALIGALETGNWRLETGAEHGRALTRNLLQRLRKTEQKKKEGHVLKNHETAEDKVNEEDTCTKDKDTNSRN